MRTAVPGMSPASCGWPARASPLTSSARAGPASSAKPSMAEESNGGTSTALVRSSASTLARASASATRSEPSEPTAPSTRSRPSSIEISTAKIFALDLSSFRGRIVRATWDARCKA